MARGPHGGRSERRRDSLAEGEFKSRCIKKSRSILEKIVRDICKARSLRMTAGVTTVLRELDGVLNGEILLPPQMARGPHGGRSERRRDSLAEGEFKSWCIKKSRSILEKIVRDICKSRSLRMTAGVTTVLRELDGVLNGEIPDVHLHCTIAAKIGFMAAFETQGAVKAGQVVDACYRATYKDLSKTPVKNSSVESSYQIKKEVKTEIKKEVKTEVKKEVKEEAKEEIEEEIKGFKSSYSKISREPKIKWEEEEDSKTMA